MPGNSGVTTQGRAGAWAVMSVLGRAIRMVRTLHHRRQINELMSYDDRMLRDIGVTRLDLHRALSGPLASDPSRELSRLRHRGPCNKARSDSACFRSHS